MPASHVGPTQPNALQICDAYAQVPLTQTHRSAHALPVRFGKHKHYAPSKPKRYQTSSNLLPLGKRNAWVDIGGYKVATEPPVTGRGDIANRQAAEELKQLIDDEMSTADTTEVSSHPVPRIPSNSSEPPQTPSPPPVKKLDPILRQAFRREYSSPTPFKYARSTSCVNSVDIDEDIDVLSYSEADHTEDTVDANKPQIGLRIMRDQREVSVPRSLKKALKRSRSPVDPARPLFLPGMGAGRQRNEFGKSLMGGQELGIGVIGSDSLYEIDLGGQAQAQAYEMRRMTEVIHSEAGCDMPITRPSNDDPDYDHGQSQPAQIVSLDAELPPLAIEHPARVWNVKIHSLPHDLQPIIKWDYDRVTTAEGGSSLYIAHLTLILPPTHPAIFQHPLFHTLPKNRWTREYVTSVEALGGIKRWTGLPRKLKADAQNTTLVKCISADALAWVQAPDMDDIGKVEEDLEEDMELGDPEQRAGSVAHDVGEEAHPHETAEGLGGTHSVNEAEEIEDADQVTGERSDFIPSRQETTHVQQTQGNEQEIQIDEQEASSHSPPQPLILRTPESQQAQSSYHLEDRSNQDDQQEEDPEVTLFKLLTNTLGSGSAMKQSTIYDARGSRFGASLTIDHLGYSRVYQEDPVHQVIADARTAVCRKALNLNVAGLIKWLGKQGPAWPAFSCLLSSGHESPASQDATLVAESIVSPSEYEEDEEEDVDWVSRLEEYCHSYDVRTLTWTQTSIREDDTIRYSVQVKVGSKQLGSFRERFDSADEAWQNCARSAMKSFGRG